MTRARRNPLDPPEDIVQRWIIGEISDLAPEIFVAHVPNGGKRGKFEAFRLKESGVRRGVPDLLCVLSTGEVAFIEVKKKGGRMSPEQTAFRQMCITRGTKYIVLDDHKQVKVTLETWGELRAVPQVAA